jgi:hypothetical protein
MISAVTTEIAASSGVARGMSTGLGRAAEQEVLEGLHREHQQHHEDR